MGSSQSDTGDDHFFEGRVGLSVLGITYLLVGIGLAVSLVVDSMALFGVVLVAVLAMVAVSFYALYQREGLVTAENKVIGACVLLAMGLLFGLSGLTDLPHAVVFGLVFVVGLVVPRLILDHTRYGSPE